MTRISFQRQVHIKCMLRGRHLYPNHFSSSGSVCLPRSIPDDRVDIASAIALDDQNWLYWRYVEYKV